MGAARCDQDSKYFEHEKHQLKRYFESIVNSIKDTDEVVIFGPAETTDKFFREPNENHLKMVKKVKTLEKVDSMTENQFKALVKNTFKM